jgi:hypothetical protein
VEIHFSSKAVWQHLDMEFIHPAAQEQVEWLWCSLGDTTSMAWSFKL